LFIALLNRNTATIYREVVPQKAVADGTARALTLFMRAIHVRYAPLK
jgi:hypothetical protein